MVLAQRGGALARPGIESHQVPLGWLVQRIQRQPTQRVGDCCLKLAQPSLGLCQLLQGRREIPARPLSFAELPLIEGIAGP